LRARDDLDGWPVRQTSSKTWLTLMIAKDVPRL
jgi:hypothetical protein